MCVRTGLGGDPQVFSVCVHNGARGGLVGEGLADLRKNRRPALVRELPRLLLRLRGLPLSLVETRLIMTLPRAGDESLVAFPLAVDEDRATFFCIPALEGTDRLADDARIIS